MQFWKKKWFMGVVATQQVDIEDVEIYGDYVGLISLCLTGARDVYQNLRSMMADKIAPVLESYLFL